MRRGGGSRCVLAAAALLLAPPVGAMDFSWKDIEGQFDTTLTAGAAFRMQERDPGLVSRGNGGTGLSSNIDDGNLNYEKHDITYAPLQVNHDLNLKWGDYGIFARAYYFYDNVNTDFSEAALNGRRRRGDVENVIGKNAQTLDAYVYANFELFERPATLRLGKQVISWGESTFIQFGINSINTYDVTRLRFPGAELKNVFVPMPLAYFQMELSENLGFETFYQLGNREVVIDPQGSLFGQVDGLAVGGDFLILESRFFEQNEVPDGYKIFRRPDVTAPTGGQYGLSFNYIVPQWDSMEFGVYFMNVHSSLPVTSGYSLSQQQWNQLNELLPGTGLQDPTGLTGVLLLNGLVNPESLRPDQIEKLRGIRGLGGYQLEYREDIQIYGLSVNTLLPFGVALQGEVSYRKDQPFQIDDYELVYHGLSPTAELAGPVGGTLFDMFFTPSQLGTARPGSYFEGFRRMDMVQVQFTGSYLFGPKNPFFAQQWIMLVEVGATQVLDMPDKRELRFEAPGTFEKGGVPEVSDDFYADDFGWGYRVLTILNYPNIFGTAINFNPQLTFFHDVDGTPAGPVRSFVEDSMQAQLILRFEYLSRWAVDLGYNAYFGTGDEFTETNLIHDRDTLAFSVKYAF